MAIKYKIKLKDLKLEYLKEYIAPIFNFLKPKKKIKNIDDLKNFIQRKSAWVSQETLYGYLKTRMGAKHIIMFEDKDFLKSINIAKWQIYVVSLIDCTFFCFSFLYKEKKFTKTDLANQIFFEILNNEKANGMDSDAYENATKEFNSRFPNINWETYCNNKPFENSAFALYKWAPIADELKKFDKQIVLNSVFLKWNNVQKDFKKLVNNFTGN